MFAPLNSTIKLADRNTIFDKCLQTTIHNNNNKKETKRKKRKKLKCWKKMRNCLAKTRLLFSRACIFSIEYEMFTTVIQFAWKMFHVYECCYSFRFSRSPFIIPFHFHIRFHFSAFYLPKGTKLLNAIYVNSEHYNILPN